MAIKDSLLSRVPIVSDFQSNIFKVRFSPKIDVRGPKQGVKCHLNFYNPKRHIFA